MYEISHGNNGESNMTIFYEMCDKCGHDAICECPECEGKDKIIRQLLEACRLAYKSSNEPTVMQPKVQVVLNKAIKEADNG